MDKPPILPKQKSLRKIKSYSQVSPIVESSIKSYASNKARIGTNSILNSSNDRQLLKRADTSQKKVVFK